jgi:glycerol-3-phosphate dehydrogenase
VDVVVIGGGVIGCAIAFELARRGIDGVVLVEREPDVGEGASKANSGIVHTGFDAKPGTVEARMLRRAADLWPDLVELLEVPYLAVGALMLARTPDELRHLRDAVGPGAAALGVETELLEMHELQATAPYATDAAMGALSIPGEAVIDPFWLTRAYAEAAMAGGAVVIRGVAVTALEVETNHVTVSLADGRRFEASQVIDAAGLHADAVAQLAGDGTFAITPRRGQFLVSEETFGVDRIVLPVPGAMGKGMLVTPIVFGGLLLGPTALDIEDKSDRGVRPDESRSILDAASALVPSVAGAVPVRSFVGLRPVSSTGDHILRASGVSDRVWLACGIRSTGISVSPAVAEHVADEVLRARGWITRPRRLAPPPLDLPEDAGAVVCLCRGVSHGELVGACRRPLGPLSLDGVKRRGGAMFGDCQGNMCAVGVAGVLADELAVDVTDIPKGGSGSWVFARSEGGSVMPAGFVSGGASEGPPMADDVDLVIVGLGHAGHAAAETATVAGLRIVGLDRRMGRTVVGLLPTETGWDVEVQGEDGTTLVSARSVLLATGGYVQPREQRGVSGPRPAGVVTSDLVEAALAAGVLPGRVAVVVGAGALASRTEDALENAGVRVVARLAEGPTELRGSARLEAIRSGTGWLAADTLVYADRLVPQPFLLRGLGLVDGRPGTPAPVDGAGRVGPPGLWAAGCCVVADADHSACVEDGRRVAGSIVDASRTRMAG